MDAKTYIVEILLRARDEISRVAQKALDKMNEVVDAQKKSDQAHQESVRAENAHVSSIEKLVEAHTREKKGTDEKVAAIKGLISARKQEIDSINRNISALEREARTSKSTSDQIKKEQLEQIRNLRSLAAAREEDIGKVDKQVQAWRRSASAIEAAANDESAAHEKTTSSLNRQIGERRNHISSMKDEISELERLSTETKKSENQGRGFISMLRRMQVEGDDANNSVAKLGLALKGFQIAFAIKYAQALVTVMIGLAGALVSVASSAVQAGIALGASLASGASQALPVFGLLAAAAVRVTSILQAVKQANSQQLSSSHDASAAADRIRSAARQIQTAEQGVADAHRGVLRATNDLRLARRDAVREVQDLIAAEAAAERQANATSLSLESAQSALRQAMRSGDVLATAQAESDLGDARVAKTQSTQTVTRARQDAAPVRRDGINGVKSYQQATMALADAKRSEKRATDQLAQARQDSASAADKETAANDRLASMLDKLSPAERGLYNRLLDLQKVYKKNIGPITDIIIRSFSRVADKISDVIQDPKVLGSLTKLSHGIAGAIDRLTNDKMIGKGKSFFSFMADEATKNLPKVTSIIEKLFDVFRNIAKAGAPAFKMLLDFADSLAGRARSATSNIGAMSAFFKTGIGYLKSWVELGIQIGRLFLAVIGASADQGVKSIGSITDKVRDATAWIQTHQRRVREFFSESASVAKDVAGIIGAVAKELIRLFSPANVSAFADFLKSVLIPAIGNTVAIMGKFTQIAHEILSLPIVSDLAQWALTVALLSRGLTILSGAFKAVGAMMGFVSVEGKLAFVGNPWVLAISAIIAAVVLLDRKFHFLGPTFEWLKGAAKDVFGFVKRTAKDVVDWFSDVWNHGLLKWLRWPFEKAFDLIKPIFTAIIKVAGNAIGWINDHFGGGAGKAILDVLTFPFRTAKTIIKDSFDVVRGIVDTFLDLLAGRFGRIGSRISSMFTSIFTSMKNTVIDVLNTIIKGVNTAISGLNHLPGVDIGKIGLIDKDGPANNNPGDTSNLAATMIQFGSAAPLPGGVFGAGATGGRVDAHPGGRLILVGEAGHDEVVLTTDPKHRNRQKGLLAEYLKRTNMAFGQGGFVAEPGTNFSVGQEPLIARALAKLGQLMHSTIYGISGYRTPQHSVQVGGFPNDPHTRGEAADVGVGSALRASAAKLTPALLARVGLYRPFYPADPNEINHVQLLSTAVNNLGKLLSGVAHGDVGSIVKVAGAAEQLIPAALRRSVVDLIGKNPGGKVGGVASGALGAVWKRAASAIRAMRDQARDMTTSASGGTIGGLGGFSGGGDAAQNVRLGQKMSKAAGWVGSQWSALKQLWTNESGWRTNADNPTSTAYGIPQGLEPISAAYHNSAAEQIRWGLNYIKGRYGDPMKALAFWNAQSPHWYEQGGPVAGQGAQPAVLHGGEHVWTASEVARAGGHQMMSLMRKLLGGGGQGFGSYAQGGRVLEIGDSLGVGIQQYLEKAIKRINTDNRVGRPSDEAIGILKDKLKKAYREVILDIGTNDENAQALAKSLRQARKIIGGDRSIIISKIHGSGVDADAKNAVLEHFARRNSNVTLVDPRGQIGPDGIHYTPEGYQKRAQAFISAARNNSSPASELGRQVGDRISGKSDQAVSLMKQIETMLDGVNKALKKGSDGATKLRKAFTRLFEDGGLLDQMDARVDLIGNRGSVALQNRQFSVNRRGKPHRDYLTPTQVDRSNLDTLQSQRGVLENEADALDDARKTAKRGINDAQDRMSKAKKGSKKYKKAQDDLKQAQAALLAVNERAQTNAAALAQNAQDQVEALESYQQALFDVVNNTAASSMSAIDRFTRFFAAKGHALKAGDIAKAQQEVLQKQLDDLGPVLRQAEKSGNVDLIKTIHDQMSELSVQIAESVESQFQDAIDEVNKTASDSNAAIDRFSRWMSAIGHSMKSGQIASAQEKVLRQQYADLSALLAQASQAGNTDMVTTLQGLMGDLQVSIAESVAAQFQSAVDDVNNLASKSLASNDRAQRLAQIGGVNYGALGSALQDRGSILAQQRSGLAALYAQAQQAGNIDQMESLGDQISDLNVAIAENTQAVTDNTDAAFAKKVSDINSSFSFSSGIFSAASSFFSGLGNLTGQQQTPALIGLAQGQQSALNTQRAGLLGALGGLLGYSSSETAGLQQLQGSDLVNTLLSMSQGPMFQSIMSRLDPAQQQQFQDLINALIGNASATTENTATLNELNGLSNTQSFQSSFWSTYRMAIFNGAGQLLPQYASAAPRAHNGTLVARDGLYNLQAGERVTPVREAREAPPMIGEQHDHWHITTPKEVVDGKSLARETAWARSHSPRGSEG